MPWIVVMRECSWSAMVFVWVVHVGIHMNARTQGFTSRYMADDGLTNQSCVRKTWCRSVCS